MFPPDNPTLPPSRQALSANICQRNHKPCPQSVLGCWIGGRRIIDASRFLFSTSSGGRRCQGSLRLASVQVISRIKTSRRDCSIDCNEKYGALRRAPEFFEAFAHHNRLMSAGHLQLSLTIFKLVTRMSPASAASFFSCSSVSSFSFS